MNTNDSKTVSLEDEMNASKLCKSLLDETLRRGAQTLLKQAIENEVEQYIQAHQDAVDDNGKRLVVRNGHHRKRSIQTGVGTVEVKQPRVRDKRPGNGFSSSLLPQYMRRCPSLDATVAALYLKGVSTNAMVEALGPILGEKALGLSSSNVTRLMECWRAERKAWDKRDLSGKQYVYVWADGVYFNVRLSDDRPCVLVLIGALEDGTKELIAICDGERESKLSWKSLLLDVKDRGRRTAPKLAIADGALGFWAALEEVFPSTQQQRCWVHKTANVLDKLPKKIQPKAKESIHEIYMAATKEDAFKAYDRFIDIYGAKYEKACQCLQKDKEVLMCFYCFPAEHWKHIRTTNPIESTFATLRHRQRLTKGNGNRESTLAMVYKLATEAQKHWRKISASELLDKVVQGVCFVDGIETNQKVA